jgi:CDP-paratose 2-epimerase
VLYSSTNKVYGDLQWARYEERATRYVAVDYPDGFPETITLEFHSPYGCSKGAADQYMLDYARIFALNTVVFRHSSMYGGRQFSTYDQGWIGWFCQQALEAKRGRAATPFPISGNGKQVRDLLHATDMVRLYFAAVEHIEVARGRAFNIGGGPQNSLSLLELFQFLEAELDVSLTWEQLPVRESDQRVFIADIRRARELLNWQPETAKEDGLKSMIDWVTQNV